MQTNCVVAWFPICRYLVASQRFAQSIYIQLCVFIGSQAAQLQTDSISAPLMLQSAPLIKRQPVAAWAHPAPLKKNKHILFCLKLHLPVFGQFKAFKSDVINTCLISDNFPVSVSCSCEDSCFYDFSSNLNHNDCEFIFIRYWSDNSLNILSRMKSPRLLIRLIFLLSWS